MNWGSDWIRVGQVRTHWQGQWVQQGYSFANGKFDWFWLISVSRCWCFEISQVQFRRVALCVCVCMCARWLWHIQFNLYEYLACQPFPWRISKQTLRAYSHQNESGSESVKDKRINSKQKIFFVLSRSLSLGLNTALTYFIDLSIGWISFFNL